MSLGLHKGRPSYRRSLQPSKREHPALRNMKFLPFLNFFLSFLPSWVWIHAVPDPDPQQSLISYGGIHGKQDHVDELNMTNALINERKEELEERLNNKDRELSELKVPTFPYTFIFRGFLLKINGTQLQRSIHE
jgi:hypothetical protein